MEHRILPPPPSSSSKLHVKGDRFIPSRSQANLDDALDILENEEKYREMNSTVNNIHEKQFLMNSFLRSELLGQSGPDIISESHNRNGYEGQLMSPARKEITTPNSVFKSRSSLGKNRQSGSLDGTLTSPGEYDGLTSFSSTNSPVRRSSLGSAGKPPRKIAKAPYKVLDAPQLQDDYYLNLLDWSPTNILAVALADSVFLWSAFTSKVTKLCDFSQEQEQVTSISWATVGQTLAIGTSSGRIEIWDAQRCMKIQELRRHDSRVGSLAWNSSLLASGSRDRAIFVQDIRMYTHHNNQYQHHPSPYNSPNRIIRIQNPATTLAMSETNAAASGSTITTLESHSHTVSTTSIATSTASQSTNSQTSRRSRITGRRTNIPTIRPRTARTASSSTGDLLEGISSNHDQYDNDDDDDELQSIEMNHDDVHILPEHRQQQQQLFSRDETLIRPFPDPEAVLMESPVLVRQPADDDDDPFPQLTSILSNHERSLTIGSPMQPHHRNLGSIFDTTSELTQTIFSESTPLFGRQLSDVLRSLPQRRNLSQPLTTNIITNTTSHESGSSVNGGSSLVKEYRSHRQEVCGLKWSFDEKMLASGGNDNKLFVWDITGGNNRRQSGNSLSDDEDDTANQPLYRFEDHTAAVKAVAWSPHQAGLLASGGGTADRHIRFWNTNTGVPLHKIDTGSQVRILFLFFLSVISKQLMMLYRYVI
jgi:WD40 repeat protein